MKQFIELIERKETPARWEANKNINAMIMESLRESIKNQDYSIPVVTKKRHFFPMITISEETKDIPYGSSTLGASGCAVFCFEQGLRVKEIAEIDISELAAEIARKGYYEPGKGTYHNLFDHMGLRRARHVQEIFDTILTESDNFPLITLLVRNKEYNGRNGKHFINISDYIDGKFLVHDSSIGRKFVSADEILNAIEVAWIW